MNKKLMIGSLVLIFAFIISTVAVTAQTSMMKSELGVDFGDQDFAIEVDFNVEGNFALYQDSAPSHIDVVRDLVNGATNPQVVSTDSNPAYDQQFYMAYHNVSGIETTYLAMEKMEGKFVLEALGTQYEFGAFNGTAPFQTLLQHYTHDGKDVLVANTFRGFMAYTTTANDPEIDSDDDVLLGYSVVESHVIDKLNDELSDENLTTISNYNAIPFYNETGFGMRYDNMFVVFQDTTADTNIPLNVPGADLYGFESVATGGAIKAAVLFDYVDFTYNIVELPESNDTHKFVDVITRYDLGPVNLMITVDTEQVFNILTGLGAVDADECFRTEPFTVVFPTGYGYDYNASIPAFSIYTGDSAKARIDVAALEGQAEGYGISLLTTTNVFTVGYSVTLPNYYNGLGGTNIPLAVGGNTFFETKFVGKDTYTLDPNGVPETHQIYLANPTFTDLANLIDIASVFNGYFDAQTKMTMGYTVFAANNLMPAFGAISSGATIDMTVEDTAYMTLLQMPKWGGREIYQDPTYSAVSAVAAQGDDTSSSTESKVNTNTTNTSLPIPGFEVFAVSATILALVLYRRRK